MVAAGQAGIDRTVGQPVQAAVRRPRRHGGFGPFRDRGFGGVVWPAVIRPLNEQVYLFGGMIAFPISAVVAEEVTEPLDPRPVERVSHTAGQHAVLTRAGVDPQQGRIALIGLLTHVAGGTRVPDEGAVRKHIHGVGLMVSGGNTLHQDGPVARRRTVAAERETSQTPRFGNDQRIVEQSHIMREIKVIEPSFWLPGPPFSVVGEGEEDDAPSITVADQHGLVVEPFHACGATEVADQQVDLHAVLHHRIVHVRIGPNLACDDEQKQRGHQDRYMAAPCHDLRPP